MIIYEQLIETKKPTDMGWLIQLMLQKFKKNYQDVKICVDYEVRWSNHGILHHDNSETQDQVPLPIKIK